MSAARLERRLGVERNGDATGCFLRARPGAVELQSVRAAATAAAAVQSVRAAAATVHYRAAASASRRHLRTLLNQVLIK